MLRKQLPQYMSPDQDQATYENWVAKGLFSSQTQSKDETPFSIVMPPPNVTGVLHLGHAWDHTLQDVLTRYHKMKGCPTLWVPGTDHAGIATQMMVEKQIMKEDGKTKHDLGREKFIAKVWNWKEEYGGNIVSQMKFLGDACDWDEFHFTLDDTCSKAVRKSFVELYNKGLIYREQKLINWSTKLESALSDLEVEHRNVKGFIWTLAYPVVGEDTVLHVATTRPETFLGDTAVAVHPEDERYKDIIGKKVILPLVGREVPIIADSYVDPEFGTGVVKITPAHDFNDYEVGKRHNLEKINLLKPNGLLNENAAQYEGLNVVKAREKILEDLEAKGALIEVKDHNNSVGFCQRSNCIVEPYLSYQWFVKMDGMGKKAAQAVENKDIEFIPDSSKKVFLNWMSILEDWCISRQLWWGHRVPAWKCLSCDHYTVAEEDPSVCQKCSSDQIKQDEDVLDTWFSSGLWPFEVLGWPDKDNKLYKTFYPTSVLVTGFDIIFFWVARMIMMGLEFTDNVPFKKVYLHGMIRDSQGKKMSKTAGNAVDPMDIIKEHGADTLRFTFLSQTQPGKDIKLSKERVVGYRNFLNKIWNASKFVSAGSDLSLMKKNLSDLDGSTLNPVDVWILVKLKQMVQKVEKSLKNFDFSAAADTLYHFVWNDYCDWYLEAAKKRFYSEDEKVKAVAQNILYHVLRQSVITLHPFVPFVTESIYQALFSSSDDEYLIQQDFCQLDGSYIDSLDQQQSTQVDLLFKMIQSIRSIRSENQIKPSQKIKAHIVVKSGLDLEKHKDLVVEMAALSEIAFKMPESMSKTAFHKDSDFEVCIPLEGLVDFQKELERLEKNLGKERKLQESLIKRLENKNFVSSAPAEVVEEHKQQLEDSKQKIAALQDSISRLS